MHEFDIIAKYFRPLTEGHDLLQDDAAVLSVPADHELVVSSDTLNAGTHFLENASPDQIARKALRVNLSDLAAMGAKPFSYQLNIAFPFKPDGQWLEKFTAALRADHKEFGIFCSGGDTTSIKGPLSISITAMGIVPSGKAVRRKGAKPGDHLVITGPVGDALIGLRVLQKKIRTENDNYFIKAYYEPTPRTQVVNIVRQYAHAAVDISDGLVADVGHIAEASGCGLKIQWTPGIFSRACVPGLTPADLLTGGDDYELALAVPADKAAMLLQELRTAGLKPVKAGEFMPGQGVSVLDEKGAVISLKNAGWQHF